MKQFFNCIGIIGNPRSSNFFTTHYKIYDWLVLQNYTVVVEISISKVFLAKNPIIKTLKQIGESCDLAIVIGGDGNMLHAARILSHYDIKIIGINRGNLGFLTDLNPDSAIEKLRDILSGKFIVENRIFLECKVYENSIFRSSHIAINEIVLHSKKIAKIIEFEVFINGKFSFSQRSDGLIISTPTGSTGYSLSAGGPILFSSLNAIVLVPIFPHTLSSRPIVISDRSIICLKFFKNFYKLRLTFDGNNIVSINYENEVFINVSKKYLELIHPVDYHYFDRLSSKLNWSKKLF